MGKAMTEERCRRMLQVVATQEKYILIVDGDGRMMGICSNSLRLVGRPH